MCIAACHTFLMSTQGSSGVGGTGLGARGAFSRTICTNLRVLDPEHLHVSSSLLLVLKLFGPKLM
jgi:hypothetical protein